MPKETRKESQKGKGYEKPLQKTQSFVNMKTVNPNKLDILNNFMEHHTNEINSLKGCLLDLQKQNENLLLECTQKENIISEINEFFNKKKEVIDKMVNKFDFLQAEQIKLIDAVQKKTAENAKLELNIDKAQKIIEQLTKGLKEKKEKMRTIIIAKEAECGAYLKEMKAQFEKANLQAKNDIIELNQKIADFEAKEQQMMKTINDNNLKIAEFEDILSKKLKKIEKKNNLIKDMKKDNSSLQAEKKDLEQKLEIQGRKMRELQTILGRPERFVMPLDVGKQVNKDEHQVEVQQPIIVPIEPNNQNAQANAIPMSPAILNTQVLQQNNEVPSIISQEQPNLMRENQIGTNRVVASPQSDIGIVSAMNRSFARPNVQQPRKRTSTDTDDWLIPPYTSFKKRSKK